MNDLLLLPLGILAGALTTVTGLGGGILLLLSLAMVFDPATALTITAPALLAGNLHRLFMFRRALNVSIATRLIAGALPGALLGGTLAVQLPEWMLRSFLVVATAMVLATAFGWIRIQPTQRWVLPIGVTAGAVTALGGGGGLLVPPTLLALGLRGAAFLATGAAAASGMHVGRLAAYGLAGWMSPSRWMLAGLLALAIPLGNLVGGRIRTHLSEALMQKLTYGSLTVATLLAVGGLT